MAPQATMIIIDNSRFSRNGDILPTRFDAQIESLRMMVNARLQENRESSVGLMTMGAGKVECLVTFVKESQQIMGQIGKVRVTGQSNLLKAIQIAQLSLKHRSNKNQTQRIMVMVASPVKASQSELAKVARNLKRNNISLDILNLGEAGNTEKLRQMIDSVNVDDNSNFMNIEASVSLLSDSLVGTPFLGGGVIAQTSGMVGGEAMDPELEMALRISLEEEQRRQQTQNMDANEGQMEQENLETINEEVGASQTQTENSGMTTEDQQVIEQAKNIGAGESKTQEEKDDEKMLIQNPDFIKGVLDELGLGDQNVDDFIQDVMEEEDKGDKKDAKKEDSEKQA